MIAASPGDRHPAAKSVGDASASRLYLETLDEAGLPGDELFREAVRSYLEFGSRVTQQNSRAETDAELHPIRNVAQWNWPD